jgi:PAS domain S-box-containing protein
MMNPSHENSCRIVVESHNHVLFTFDDLGIITTVSHGCTGMLGFLPEEMTGRLLSAFVIPEDKGRVGEMCEQAKRGIHDPSCFHIVDNEGGIHPAIAISHPVFAGEERTVSIGIVGEINRGERAEKMVRQANTTIHHLNSIVRHDINNQLTVLNGYLSLIEQDDSTITSKEIVGILLDATEKIHTLVTFTTEYKEIGKHSPVWTNLYEAFQASLSTVDAPGVRIIAESSCQEIELFCDPMLVKALYQLIDHSLCQEKAVSEIFLRWKPGNGGAIIVYEDNGAGISEPVKSILFQPDKMKKNGDGLFLAHEILAIFGFSITETGTPGKGMRFEIGVPAGSFRIIKKK